jgi:phosphate transport system substrate-binding protein
MRTKLFFGFPLLLAAVLGCDSSKPTPVAPTNTATKTESAPAPVSALQGTVTADGSSTVYPITEAAAAGFREKFPKVEVTVGKSGTGGGFKRFVKGESDISNASRPIKKDEMAECVKNGVQFIELPVAYDGITICVHNDNNFISEITVDDLKKIFSADLAIKTWQELNPAYPAEPIKILMPGTDSGTYDFFKEVVVGKEGKIRSDVTPSEEDLVIVNGIANEKFSIGFFGASYYFENKTKLKALKVVDPKKNEAVEPTLESIENSTYTPFGRPLFVYVNMASIKRPELRRFVEFYLDNAVDLCKKVKCVPLPEALSKTIRQNFDDPKSGTYFTDAEGKSRHGTLTEVYVEQNLNQPK